MKSLKETKLVIAVTVCFLGLIIVLAQFIFKFDEHKYISDYLKSYEQIISEIENTHDVNAYIELSKRFKDFSDMSQQIRQKDNWTEADDIKMSNLTKRYNLIAQRYLNEKSFSGSTNYTKTSFSY